MKHFQLNKHKYINLKLYLLNHSRGLAILLDGVIRVCTLGYVLTVFLGVELRQSYTLKHNRRDRMILCKDCNHYRKDIRFGSKCTGTEPADNVEGTLVLCKYNRLEYKPCGPQALLFEPKQYLWDKLKNILCKPS
jgi:hypothetical protein